MEKLQIKLEKWVNGGYSLSHYDGHAVFVDGGIPGETVDITLTKQGNKEWFGTVDAVIESSPLRVPSDCPVYLECGGCSYRHISYEEEVKVKTSLLEFMFPEWIGKAEVVTGPSIGYRNNVQWQVEGGQIGFFAKNTHRIIPDSSTHCKNVDKRLLIENPNDFGILSNEKPKQNRFPKPSKDSKTQKNTNSLSLRLSQNAVVLYEKEETKFEFLSTKLTVPAKGFFQINQFLLETWIQKIKSLLPKDANVLELFCGCGTIGITLRDRIKSLYGIESHEKSIEYANQNAKANGITTYQYTVLDLYQKHLSKDLKIYSTWIVNPPRAGLSKGLIETAAILKPREIVYSSCNPSTLRRDVISFKEIGYEMDHLSLFDFFPRTNHYEVLVRLRKRK
ncbi:tRNA (uracil-5-)-methyltransferase [Leptospira sp. mixed culture ATI2-C-A1]|uniref:class I SAM-dependent RNA methyltransferase n=1 Tax=Leptospira levettii TaxID=2023178 RepID=UPI000C2A317C|nr:methyltransferase domain-containing protein [Leptospira levettii]PKA27822.1 tRNA (uracil-5-)-methyltransferase [Leptospira sp. mixed culture ATI2-C-A1]TGM92330.1 class I SAM-dependent RNA methyltransferase [Leptospira levettii]